MIVVISDADGVMTYRVRRANSNEGLVEGVMKRNKTDER